MCHQPRSAHLRTDARENVADLSPIAELLAEVSFLREEEVTCRLFGDRTPIKRAGGGRVGRVGHPFGKRAGEAAAWGKAADRDCLCKPQAGFWSRRDVGEDSRWACRQDLKAKITVYTYAFLVNRLRGRPQGRIKDLWV